MSAHTHQPAMRLAALQTCEALTAALQLVTTVSRRARIRPHSCVLLAVPSNCLLRPHADSADPWPWPYPTHSQKRQWPVWRTCCAPIMPPTHVSDTPDMPCFPTHSYRHLHHDVCKNVCKKVVDSNTALFTSLKPPSEAFFDNQN
jgi:hypothetical protein